MKKLSFKNNHPTNYEKWLIQNFGGKTGKDSIVKKTVELLKSTGQNNLPVRLSKIASYIGINPQPIYRNQKYWGELIMEEEELRICLKMKTGKPPNPNWRGFRRLRFSYAHELIHCLHYDLFKKPPVRIAPLPEKNFEEEIICNIGARNLLLPPFLIKKVLKSLQKKDDFPFIAKQLSQIGAVSLHVAFIQLLENNYFNKKNKIYIISNVNKGLNGLKEEKPRCIASAIYLGKKIETFLHPYQGIEHNNKNWSLVLFFKNFENMEIMKIKNEIIKVKEKKYLITKGLHKKITNSYVWSDLDFEVIE